MNRFNPKPEEQSSRRTFLRRAGAGAAALAGLPAIAAPVASCMEKKSGTTTASDIFKPNDVVLFQGDSITDALRDRKDESANRGPSFGVGYAFLIAAGLLEELPDRQLSIYNRGISGNKVYQLAERWQKDCLDLKPDKVSILIGVNDYWHMRQGRYDGTPEIYEKDYRALLTRTLEELPGVRLVVCEPFILPGTSAVDDTWIEPFSRYRKIAGALAKEFETVWVPFQKAFDQALELAPASYWLYDGVHPSMAGAQLMAETWLQFLCS